MSNSDLWLKHSDLAKWNLSSLEVIIVLKWHVFRIEVIVWGSVVLFEACEFLTHLHLTLKHSAEVPSGEQTVVRNSVVKSCWLVVMVVLEAGSVRMTKEEWHESVTIIDSIQLFTFQELLKIVLNDWSLMNSSSLSSSGVDTNAISESKNVIKSLML